MKVIIEGKAKEIADLVNLLQGRLLEDAYFKSGPSDKALTTDELPLPGLLYDSCTKNK